MSCRHIAGLRVGHAVVVRETPASRNDRSKLLDASGPTCAIAVGCASTAKRLETLSVVAKEFVFAIVAVGIAAASEGLRTELCCAGDGIQAVERSWRGCGTRFSETAHANSSISVTSSTAWTFFIPQTATC